VRESERINADQANRIGKKSMPPSPPDMSSPPSANRLFRSNHSPQAEARNADGVTSRIAHVAHVQIPDLQSGCSHSIRPITPHGMTLATSPTIPRVLPSIDILPLGVKCAVEC